MDSVLVERIRALGARATPVRVAVLRILGSSERALSHHDLEMALADSNIDRVTLYRVLDWLVKSRLAHRVTDAQRIFRFSLADTYAPQHDKHAHFQCIACGKVFCLDTVRIKPPPLPKGYLSSSVELYVTGLCAGCNSSAPA